MFRILVITSLLSLSQSVFTQELITDSTIVLKAGIYRDFFEFKYNCPSRPMKYEVYSFEAKYSKGQFATTENANLYLLVNFDLKKKIYGFCDGVNIFIKVKTDMDDKPVFSKVEHLGRYAYFTSVTNTSIMPSSIGAIYQAPQLLHKVVSLTTGNTYTVSTGNISQIVKDDSDILDLVNRDNDLNDKLKTYLIMYSNKHILDIQNLANIELIRSQRKEHLYLVYNDSIYPSYSNYLKTISSFVQSPIFFSVTVDSSHYSSGELKSIHIKSKHRLGNNISYSYKIGTWIDYHKNGNINQLIDFNIIEQKHGRHQRFNKDGKITKEEKYIRGIPIKK